MWVGCWDFVTSYRVGVCDFESKFDEGEGGEEGGRGWHKKIQENACHYTWMAPIYNL